MRFNPFCYNNKPKQFSVKHSCVFKNNVSGKLSVPSSGVKQSKKMGPIGCPETSVTKNQSMLRNILEERIFNFHRDKSLILRKCLPHSFLSFSRSQSMTECARSVALYTHVGTNAVRLVLNFLLLIQPFKD
jgi:hypothetical protein